VSKRLATAARAFRRKGRIAIEAIKGVARMVCVQYRDHLRQLWRGAVQSGLTGARQAFFKIVANVLATLIVAPSLARQKRLQLKLGRDRGHVTRVARIAAFDPRRRR
jgi:hypothetical protein